MTPIFHLEQPDRVDKDYTSRGDPTIALDRHQTKSNRVVDNAIAYKSLLTPNLTQSVTNMRTDNDQQETNHDRVVA
ncbi:hypothetical protein MTP99_006304 [Tenebrio molitor]|jgi:hypothetical protein|nr:hypothetical protein MTP99_006304 [Tenebrio molitor]